MFINHSWTADHPFSWHRRISVVALGGCHLGRVVIGVAEWLGPSGFFAERKEWMGVDSPHFSDCPNQSRCPLAVQKARVDVVYRDSRWLSCMEMDEVTSRDLASGN